MNSHLKLILETDVAYIPAFMDAADCAMHLDYLGAVPGSIYVTSAYEDGFIIFEYDGNFYQSKKSLTTGEMEAIASFFPYICEKENLQPISGDSLINRAATVLLFSFGKDAEYEPEVMPTSDEVKICIINLALRCLADRIEAEHVFPEENTPYWVSKLFLKGISAEYAIEYISTYLNDETISL